MKLVKLKASIVTVALSTITLVSCNRQERLLVNDEETNQDTEQSEFVSNDADNMAEAAVAGDNSQMRLQSAEVYDAFAGGCATVTRDTLNHADADTVTIDFGANGCTGNDGRLRKGKIRVVYSGKRLDAGSVRTQTFDNYYVNNNKLEGTRTITNKGKNTAGQTYWEVIAAGMKLTKSDGKVVTWESTRTRTITAGEGTTLLSDDVYKIEGNWNGVNGKGIAYTSEITKPLVRSLDCRYIKEGTIVVRVTGKPDKTMDYGDGTCDDKATVTSGTKSKEITLK